MSISSSRSLLGKAWDSLIRRGPVGLGRDVGDYLRWRWSQPNGRNSPQPEAALSNWDLSQKELRSLPDVLESKPILIYAEATSRCNLHCFMCRLSFPETTRQTREHMRLETFVSLEPLLETGSRLSLFGLGEPLLNPNFVDMLRLAKERGTIVGLNSNAMLLSDRVARAMVELEQDILVISFSGGSKETYERVITGANYERVMANLGRLNELKRERAISHQPSVIGLECSAPSTQDSGTNDQDPAPGLPLEQVKPVLQLQFTAMRDNVHEVPDMVRLAIEMRCAGAVVMPLTIFDPSLADQSILQPEMWPQIERVFEEARQVAATAPYPFDLQLPTAQLLRKMREAALGDGETGGRGDTGTRRHGDARKDDSLPLPLGEAWTGQRAGPRGEGPHDSPTQPSICHEPWQTFYARDDGTVNTCCYSNRILGDLKKQTALEIWNGEMYQRFRARMRSENKPAECKVCHKLRGDDWYDQRVDEETFYDEL